MRNSIKYIVCAILAAALYALNAPFSKLLPGGVPPRMMASLSFVFAGESLTLPFVIGLPVMIVGTYFAAVDTKE